MFGKKATLLGIYTLTPTHFGTGQTIGAVDLPIARDESTGFPVLPATGLKGVARDYLTDVLTPQDIDCLFGKSLDESNKADAPEAGRLALTEARLVAYPVRSLNRPFLHVTCPLILERLVRDLRALGREDFLPASWQLPQTKDVKVLTADDTLAGQALVLEDLVYRNEEVAHSSPLQEWGKRLADLLPNNEQETHNRLVSSLVLIPDRDFGALIQWVIPVQARIKLTGGKTTDKWINPETLEEDRSGNLWYEEHLPPDCLFVAFVGERRQRTFAQGARSGNTSAGLATLVAQSRQLQVVQIGGNKTVGQGLCYWTLWPPKVTETLEAKS